MYTSLFISMHSETFKFKSVLRLCTPQARRTEHLLSYHRLRRHAICSASCTPQVRRTDLLKSDHLLRRHVVHIYLYVCIYIFISMHSETFKFNSVLRLCTPQARRTDRCISDHLLRRHARPHHVMK